jgi:hypothetical protein
MLVSAASEPAGLPTSESWPPFAEQSPASAMLQFASVASQLSASALPS